MKLLGVLIVTKGIKTAHMAKNVVISDNFIDIIDLPPALYQIESRVNIAQ